ncbi:MAG: amino acid ABC transporter substrate-binding protein [Paracoccaceae bacterium]|nr:amino acid ABC transporter substrate-binding protein [Paracoccaceae bacterium]
MKTIALATVAALFAGQATADVLDRIAETGVIKLGVRTDAPLFSYTSQLGEAAGLAVSLCRDAAKEIKSQLDLDTLKVEYVEVTAATRFEKLIAGETDLHCGPTTATLSRRETLDFSIPYFIDGSSVVFRSGYIEMVDDLSGETVSVLASTTTEGIVGQLSEARILKLTINTYQTHVEGLTALEEGDVAAYFGDQAILRYQLGEMRPAIPLKFSPNQFSFEPYALTMKRGEARLRLAVDRALSKTFASGAIFTHINSSMGEVTLSDLALAVYQVVTLPD